MIHPQQNKWSVKAIICSNINTQFNFYSYLYRFILPFYSFFLSHINFLYPFSVPLEFIYFFFYITYTHTYDEHIQLYWIDIFDHLKESFCHWCFWTINSCYNRFVKYYPIPLINHHIWWEEKSVFIWYDTYFVLI